MAADALTAGEVGFGTPFEAQIAFFRRKLNLPTERWDDITRAAHDRAFIVAGAVKADLLHDLRTAVDASMSSGEGLGEFRKRFEQVVAANGWTGWTGEDSAAGVAWRARVIYTTNMSASYAAGRWQQMTDPAFAALRPYWRYVHAEGELHPRPLHVAWHGITLPMDHPFFRTHFTPNGWGCRCEIQPQRAPAPDAQTEPPQGWNSIDPKTGAPPGIDKGFDYAPGANVGTSLRQMVQDKLIGYPPAIAKAMSADLNRHVYATEDVAGWVAQVLADKTITDPLLLGFVEDADAVSLAAGADVQGYAVTLPADVPRHVRAAHGWDGKGQRPAQPADFARVVAVLNGGQLRAGAPSAGHATVVAAREIDGETLRAVFQVLTGKRNRALALLSLVIKTA